MTGRDELDRLLQTDRRDVGCAQAMEMLHMEADWPAHSIHRPQRRPTSSLPITGRW